MERKQSGYVTVEAAIVIPVIVITIMTILFVVNIYYIHSHVQSALEKSVSELSYYSYMYEKSGIYGAGLEIKNSASDKKDKWAERREEFSQVVTEAQSMRAKVYRLKDDSTKFDTDTSAMGIIDQVINYLERVKSMAEAIKNMIDTTYGLGEQLLEKEDGQYVVFGDLKTIIGNKGIQCAETWLGNAIVQMLMKKNLSEDLVKRYLVIDEKSGEDSFGYKGFDMSESRYFVSRDRSKGGNYVDVIVMYKIKVPAPLRVFKEVQLVNRVRLKTWTGKTY